MFKQIAKQHLEKTFGLTSNKCQIASRISGHSLDAIYCYTTHNRGEYIPLQDDQILARNESGSVLVFNPHGLHGVSDGIQDNFGFWTLVN